MERKEAIDAAQKHLVSVLTGEASPYDIRDEAVRDILGDLCTTRDEFNKDAAYAIRELERALPYVNGGHGSWNSLGILQSTGSRIDQLAAVFSVQTSYAKGALVRYFETL